MVKLVYCVRKRPEMSRDAFSRYWLERHGPLVQRYAGALGVSRYVQSHLQEPVENEAILKSRGLAEPYDGIAELWWDDMETYRAHAHSPAAREARRALLEDEAAFIDFAHSRLFMTREHVIFDAQEDSSDCLKRLV
ncbi:MAG: EthD domain-containing protein [Ectothiorhodospiraceae bacterium]|nr:EthD domain-containing protein [Ectothiorhodospiraceae bacterium]